MFVENHILESAAVKNKTKQNKQTKQNKAKHILEPAAVKNMFFILFLHFSFFQQVFSWISAIRICLVRDFSEENTQDGCSTILLKVDGPHFPRHAWSVRLH